MKKKPKGYTKGTFHPQTGPGCKGQRKSRLTSFSVYPVLTAERHESLFSSGKIPVDSRHRTGYYLPDLATVQMAGSAHAFRTGRLNLYQSLLVRTVGGRTGLPLTREDWYREQSLSGPPARQKLSLPRKCRAESATIFASSFSFHHLIYLRRL